MEFITNFPKKATGDIIMCAELVGLKYEIRNAYRLDTKAPLPDRYAIWCEEGQVKEIELFMNANLMLFEKLQKIYETRQIPKELYEGKYLYRGCELDYWPDIVKQSVDERTRI